MKLLDLHISGFGKFHDRDLTFQDGLTVLYGKNEAGKSTLHTFIRSMLFGMERGRGRASKNDTYSKYEPWEAGSAYGGRLRFEQNGTVYRIERNFQKDKKVFTIVNETLGREEAPSKAFLDHLLCGLNETSYNNTVSIGQLKSTTDGGMVTELRNYIANMNTTGSMALNITKAAAYLKARRKEFERQLNQEAAGRYTALIGEIHTIEREISAPEYENQSPSSQHMKNQTLTLLAAKQKEQETLAQKIAKGRQILAGAELQNASSIAACRKETTNLYNEYQFVKEACEKKSKTVLASLFLILAVISAVWTAVLAFPKLPAFLSGSAFAAVVTTGGSAASLSAACGMLTLLFATAGIFLGASQKRQKQTLAHTEALLGETFSRHLGNASVSEEAMRAFHARMEEYLRFIQVLEQSEASTAKLAAEISALQERAASCDELLSRQQRVQWELEKKLERLAHCKDQVEALKHVLTENERIREEMNAIDLALDTMTELSATIRDSFGLYLNQTASDFISGITGGIYTSMSVDENLNVFLNTPSRLVPAEQVSSGTMDQVYLALRLAAARLLQKEHGSMMLLLDDSFALYDDDRLRTSLTWLAKSYGGQILLFTCHRREAQILSESRTAYHLVEI